MSKPITKEELSRLARLIDQFVAGDFGPGIEDPSLGQWNGVELGDFKISRRFRIYPTKTPFENWTEISFHVKTGGIFRTLRCNKCNGTILLHESETMEPPCPNCKSDHAVHATLVSDQRI